MPLSDVEHQPAAQARLQAALHGGRVPHAYLFAGPEGVGRAMLATRFARLLLCPAPAPAPGPDGRPVREACGRCDDCRMVDAGTHPDIHVVHRELNRFHPDRSVQRRKAIDLGIDVVRHFVIEPMGKRPARGRAKVFIVLEAERMNDSAQNALLKTLEEPPGDSFLILCADSAESMLTTVRSRCQVVAFAPLPLDFVVDRLRGQTDLAAPDARYLAALSGGSLGQSLKFASAGIAAHRPEVLHSLQRLSADPLAFAKQVLERADALAKKAQAQAGDDDEPVDAADEDDEEETESRGRPEARAARTNRRLVLAMYTAALHDVMRLAAGSAPLGHDATDPALQALAAAVSAPAAGAMIRALARAEAELELNAHAQLVFDGLAVAMRRSLLDRPVAGRAV